MYLRFRVPAGLHVTFWKLQLYQWLGLLLALLVCALVPRLLLAQAHWLFAFILRKCGSCLTHPFVAAKLRPMTWVAAWWLLFRALALLDLPIRLVDALLPLKTFGMAGLLGWVESYLMQGHPDLGRTGARLGDRGDVRREAGLVLAAQTHGDDRGQPAEHQPVGVDQHPLLLHVGSLQAGGSMAEGMHGSFFREPALMKIRRRSVKSMRYN